jgi:diguanylate cyclase (GGDEF)-like protein
MMRPCRLVGIDGKQPCEVAMFGSRYLRVEPLSDKSRIDLVTMLLSGRLPIAVMALTVTLVVALDQAVRWDHWTISVGVAILSLLVARAVIVTQFIRVGRTIPLTIEAAHLWELRYSCVVLPYASLLALLNFHLVVTGTETIRLIVVAETYGFCAGMVSRGFVRPQLSAIMTIIGAMPTAAGMFVLAASADHVERLGYAIIGALFIVYSVSSLETLRHLYKALLAQLATKQEFAGLARQDPLTGLPNRLAMRERLADEICKDVGMSQIVVLMIDLDGFKQINDRHGHLVGDWLLRSVADRLSGALRSDDLATRIGGDEFAIIQSGPIGREHAEKLSKRLIATLTAPFDHDGTNIRVGASIGIALAERHLADIDLLFEHADAAMYRAKRFGGNSFRFWQDDMSLTIAA